MSRALIALLLILACCGTSRPQGDGTGGAGGSGGTGGDQTDPCTGVLIHLGGAGESYTPLADGDTLPWLWGQQGCCHFWTSFLARGFKDDDYVIYTLHSQQQDGADVVSAPSGCIRFGDLASESGWREKICERDRIPATEAGQSLPKAGPVKLSVTIRDGIAYDPEKPSPCTPIDGPHCEARSEVTLNALAPPAEKPFVPPPCYDAP